MEKHSKILIVENSIADYKNTVLALSNLNFNFKLKRVTKNTSFNKALKSFKPDIILSEIRMPEYDSSSAYIQTLAVSPLTPFIIFTEFSNENEAIELLKFGISDYVFKGQNSQLLFSINNLIVKKKILEERTIEIDLTRERNDHYKKIIENSKDSILVFEGFRIIDCNLAAATNLNYESTEELLSKTPADLSPVRQPDGTLSVESSAKNVMLAIKEGFYSFEWVNLTKDNKPIWFEVSITALPSEGGYRIYSICRNINERKKFSHQLKKAKEKAEESDRLKTAFLANMSHEIRTPMNAIIGFSDILSSYDISEIERIKFTKLIKNNGEYLMNLINDIIDIAKIESGQLKTECADFSVHDMLNSLLKSYLEIRNQRKKHQINISLSIKNPETDIIINSDKHRINQVISNLVGNALKYTVKGNIEFGYKILHKPKEILQFYVKDSGIGIPKNKLSKIFERFNQGDNSHTREYGGAGLGLAISKNLAKLLNGKIEVESTEGIGSTFYFGIPLVKSKNQKIYTKQKQHNHSDVDLSNKTILIAEDTESNFQLLKIYLQKTKAKLIRVYNGQEAVDRCVSDSNIDLVLMDMQMPVMNGYDATREIKKIRPKLPIIAETASALEGDREKIISIGCDEYISKPMAQSDLIDKICNFI